jgi:kojibiose phosphorylase
MHAQPPPRLHHPFAILAFDWDGTAVADRREDAQPLHQLLERLLRDRVIVAIITGTNFTNIERQCIGALRSVRKENLFVLTNRGSEVYGYPAGDRPTLLWRREATQAEDELLTWIANDVRATVTRQSGLEIDVVYNRLNRRKIDLIPLPAWRDPPKARIAELIAAVEDRLHAAGIVGGIREVYELTEETARALGFPDARITTDVKHIEIGLTDKADSVRWLLREVAAPRGIEPAGIAIAGDEFGPIAGFPGSDSKLIVPEADGALYLSVGAEPNGVPNGVIHLGGGPPRFREFLAEQAALHEGLEPGTPLQAPPPFPVEPTRDPTWSIVEEGFNLSREHEIESLFTVANGYLGSRASLAEGSTLSAPATFIAGVYANPTAPRTTPGLARGPDWMSLSGHLDGNAMQLEGSQPIEHRRILDLRQGLLWREWRHEDPAGRRTHLVGLRLASLADRHLLLQLVALTPENHSSTLQLVSRIEIARETGYTANDTSLGLAPAAAATDSDLDPRAAPEITPGRSTGENPGTHSPANQTASAASPIPHTPLPNQAVSSTAAPPRERTAAHPRTICLRALGSNLHVAFATMVTLDAPAGDRFEVRAAASPEVLRERWTGTTRPGSTYRLDRIVSIFTTRDTPHPAAAAQHHLRAASSGGTAKILADHLRAWEDRWHYAAIDLQGDDFATRALHFAAYHLISAANPEDDRVSVGARALTGTAYQGHVFWDTEIYMLPFYILTHPASARALLLYRYHTLHRAREKARIYGFRGALFAWESAIDGLEASPALAVAPDGTTVRIRSAEQEHHISADIAYAVWQYWQLTADDDFFRDFGAELILETARFWASRGQIEDDGRFHIRHIIGPDEYHEDVDDNAFTNVMAQWNMERGAETVRILRDRWPERWRELSAKVLLDPEEPVAWERLAAVTYTGFDPETGIFEQFQGYHNLEEIDIKSLEPRTAPLDVLLGRERIQQSQVIKQADVVLLILLLWDRFPPAVRAANFKYYEPRCGHGSSLSPAIHALVAARLGQTNLAQRYFRQGAEIDLANNMGNAALGVHAGALGALWQAAILGFSGFSPDQDRLILDPHPPEEWRAMNFRLRWRGRTVQIGLTRVSQTHEPKAPTPCSSAVPSVAGEEKGVDRLFAELHLEEGEPIQVLLRGGNQTTLRLGQPQSATRNGSGWGAWTPTGTAANDHPL